MKGKVRNAIIIAAGVLILTVMLTVVLYYYNDKVMRDNAWVFSVEETSYNENSYSYVQKPDLNSADLETLMQIKGVGRKTAYDIINYREKHGKFTSMSQLKEISSVDDEVYMILCSRFTVTSSGYYTKNESYGTRKVNLNTATVNELMSVEGITEEIAKNIILRRKDHGDYTSVRELLDTEGVTITLYSKISDKLTV